VLNFCATVASVIPEWKRGLVPVPPSNYDSRPGFSSEMMLKRLRLAESAAANPAVVTAAAARAAVFCADVVARDGQDIDFSGIIKMFRARSTVRP